MTAVARHQRWTSDDPCPICGGHEKMHRGKDLRCFGYLHSDGKVAFCTREETRGELRPDAERLYPHLLEGNCKCGERHGESEPPRIGWNDDVWPAEIQMAKRENGSGPSHSPSAVYDYEGGLRVLRFDGPDGKRYFQQHPYTVTCKCDGCRALEKTQSAIAGVYAWGRGRVPLTLYHADELRLATAEQTIYITEGEKCADRLRAVGLMATTNPGGAGKWEAVSGPASELLRNHHVAPLEDNDLPGKRHVDDIVRDVSKYAASARRVTFPGTTIGYDVADYLDEGHDAADLDDLTQKQPDVIATSLYGKTARVYLGDEEPSDDDSEDWICRGITAKAAPTVDVGLPKVGKSLITLARMIAIAAGVTDWLGKFPITKTRVLVLAYEDPKRITQKRIWQLARGLGIWDPRDIDELFVEDHDAPFHFDDKDELLRMMRTLDRLKPGIVMVDSLSRAHHANENKMDEMRPVTRAWLELSASKQVTFDVIHHVSKVEKDSSPVLMLRGSTDLSATARHIVAYRPRKGHRARIETDGNFEYKPDPFEIEVIQEMVEFPGKGSRMATRLEWRKPSGRGSGDEAEAYAEENAADRRKAILDKLGEGPKTHTALYKLGGHASIDRELDALITEGKVAVMDKGRYVLVGEKEGAGE